MTGREYLARYVLFAETGQVQAAHFVFHQVTVRVRDGKKITHEGIKVEFVGSIGQ